MLVADSISNEEITSLLREGIPVKVKESKVRRLKRNLAIVASYNAGDEVEDIAREYGLSVVSVYRVLKKARQEYGEVY